MPTLKDKQGVPPVLRDIVMPPISNLGQTISATPTQAEVQAISTKVDAILVALRNAGLLET
ncbi:hypothetical protein [Paenibacillus naphthalenovorans]|uniref:hypothetical protein n=1 Tax=Paenibacillus naphthalenovorans TaxID=162209 RepID=UPI003D2A040D